MKDKKNKNSKKV